MSSQDLTIPFSIGYLCNNNYIADFQKKSWNFGGPFGGIKNSTQVYHSTWGTYVSTRFTDFPKLSASCEISYLHSNIDRSLLASSPTMRSFTWFWWWRWWLWLIISDDGDDDDYDYVVDDDDDDDDDDVDDGDDDQDVKWWWWSWTGCQMMMIRISMEMLMSLFFLSFFQWNNARPNKGDVGDSLIRLCFIKIAFVEMMTMMMMMRMVIIIWWSR